MSASRRMPKFEQAGKFTGENQSASRWLRRIKLDLAASNSDTISISMYLWAIDVLLEGPAAHWCDSVPKIKDILENYDTANMSEVKWLESELMKQFPGKFIPTPVDRGIRSRSHSLEASSDSGSAATRLGKLYIGENPKGWNQRPEAPQVSEVHQKNRYHDDGQYKRGSRQNTIEGNVIDEYKFHDKPTTASRSPKYHNEQHHSSTTFAQATQISKNYNTDRAQLSTAPKSILKSNTSYYRQPITRSYSSQERPNDRYSRVRSPPLIQSNHNTDQYRRPETQQPQQPQQPQQLPHAHHPTAPSRPSESRPISQSLRTSYQGVTIVPSKPAKGNWSYVPHTTSRSTRYPVQKSPNHERDPLPYQKDQNRRLVLGKHPTLPLLHLSIVVKHRFCLLGGRNSNAEPHIRKWAQNGDDLADEAALSKCLCVSRRNFPMHSPIFRCMIPMFIFIVLVGFKGCMNIARHSC